MAAAAATGTTATLSPMTRHRHPATVSRSGTTYRWCRQCRRWARMTPTCPSPPTIIWIQCGPSDTDSDQVSTKIWLMFLPARKRLVVVVGMKILIWFYPPFKWTFGWLPYPFVKSYSWNFFPFLSMFNESLLQQHARSGSTAYFFLFRIFFWNFSNEQNGFTVPTSLGQHQVGTL